MMKPIKILKIGFACSLFLAFSCPDKKTNLEDVSTETVEEKNNKDYTDNSAIYFKAQGTEPFWSLEISEKQFILKTIEDTIIMPAVQPILAADHNVKLFRTQKETTQVSIQIIQMDCTNDMSGKISPYKVTINENKEKLSLEGCGSYITDYRLHDIWVLEKLNGKKIDTTDFNREFPSMEINAGANAFSGFAGCNRMNGNLFFEPKKLHFTNIITTKMACGPNNKEIDFLKALNNITTYKIENNRLWLSNPNETLLIFKKID